MYHRVGFTAAQSAELWERWKKGEGLKSIGRAFGKPSSCIFAHLRPSGGIVPPARHRSRLALTMRNARRYLGALWRANRSGQ
jgi:IS30 family transposase